MHPLSDLHGSNRDHRLVSVSGETRSLPHFYSPLRCRFWAFIHARGHADGCYAAFFGDTYRPMGLILGDIAGRTPLRFLSGFCRRPSRLMVSAVATPSKYDAFSELVKMNSKPKQSVNRPQKEVDFTRIGQMPTFEDCYPASAKVYREVEHNGRTLRIPYRRVNLTNGEHIDLYDTTGPQGIDPRDGLPKLRASWAADREGKHPYYTQMYYARQGIITGEALLGWPGGIPPWGPDSC